MECHLGIWANGALRSWSGQAHGRLDFSRKPSDDKMILSDLFVPDGLSTGGQLPHRAAALRAFEQDAFELHLDLADPASNDGRACATSTYQCPFCAEFDGESQTVFRSMMGQRLDSRVVYEDDDFVVMPPLGEFIEGGLLLLSREHIPSFAHLQPRQFERLERLLTSIRDALVDLWRVPPLVFEHGPAFDRTKGVCCVDHAHFNIFPAALRLHPHLAQRMNCSLRALADLAKFQRAEFGYLFVQENNGDRRAYDGESVPTQLVRRIVTQSLGMPERWHWQDYPGYAELLATYNALKGRLSP
jgi:diadenosine tetraphosphate (Ap4A) HIT family hydrolase